MLGNRVAITIEVSWNLDLIPGWNHHPKDMVDHIVNHSLEGVSHYNPEVKLISVPQLVDEAPATK
jgi:hypothetical protein